MITTELVYLSDFSEKAALQKMNFGVTSKYSTGHKTLDNYLGGGYGRTNGYEIVLLYGSTGIGKSLVSLNLLADAIVKGTKVGLLVLEDDMADVHIRLEKIVGTPIMNQVLAAQNVVCLPETALDKSFTLDDMLLYIEQWFTMFKVDLILLDHLQFAFEGADSIKGENEYIAQRVFMKKLNQLMKRMGKTIILISHIGKARTQGMDKIVGSTAIAQAATKVIEIERDKHDTVFTMHKSRFTRTPPHNFHMRLTGMKLGPADVSKADS